VLVLITSGTALLLAVPSARGFGEHVFDANVVIGGGDPSFNVWSGQSVAQSFTSSETYLLLNLTLRMKNSGSTTDTVNITIRPDAAGVPAASILGSFDPITGGAIGLVNIPLSPPPQLSRGTVYWIVATKTGPQSDAYAWYHSGGNMRLGGKAMVNAGAGWVDPGTPTDMYFVTYGRALNANLTLAMTAAPAEVLVKDLVTLKAFFNNTGDRPAQRVWLNASLPPGLSYVSDTAGGIPSGTPFPAYTFYNVLNGANVFTITATVDVGVPAGSVLTASAVLTFTNATGVLGPTTSASASVIVGLQGKELYLVPGNPGPPQALTPARPTGGPASQVTYVVKKGGPVFDFELAAPLARAFRTTVVNATLYIDSPNHDVKGLDINLTLGDWNGATLTPVAQVQAHVTTNVGVDYQPFTFVFPGIDHTFPTGNQIRLTVRNMGSSAADAVLATNSTLSPSWLGFVTTTYVAFDSIELRDDRGPSSVWTPMDRLVVRVTVADPFGETEIAGTWWTLRDPAGATVVSFAPMTLIGTDPSAPPAWQRFESMYGPSLTLGTYRIEVTAVEGNGAIAVIAASALVRSPSFTLQASPTPPSVLGGDGLFYQVWYNNSGSAPAANVWINATLASEVTFLTSSAEANRTGPAAWEFMNTGVGAHFVLIGVQVRNGLPPGPTFRTSVALDGRDEKGHPLPSLSATADAALGGPVVSIALATGLSGIHQNETFAISVSLVNSGDTAQSLWANVTLPAGLVYVSDTSGSVGGTSAPTGNGVDVQLPPMSPGASWSYDVGVRSRPGLPRGTVLTTTATLEYTNARGGMMPPGGTARAVVVISPLVTNATLRLDRLLAVPGDIVSATVDFANVGDEPARDVWVNLTLDPRFAFVGASMAVTVQGGTIRFHLSNVGIADTRVFLNVSVAASTADRALLGVAGAIDYTDGLGGTMPTVQFPSVSVTVTAPRLTLTSTPSVGTMEAGTTSLFTVTPANPGTGTAGDVWLNATLPADLVYVSDTSDGQRTVIGRDLAWHWQGFGPGTRGFSLVLSARASARDQSMADLSLQLQYTDANGNPRTDLAASSRVTFIAPTIRLTLTVSQDTATVGTTFFYTLRARNVGTTAANTLWLIDSLNAQLALFSYTSSVPATGTSTLNWTYRTLQPGEEQAVTLFARVVDGTAPGTTVPNAIEAVFTNSEGSVIGYSQSSVVTVSVVEAPSPLPYVVAAGVAALAPVGFLVYRRSRSRIEQVFLVTKDGILIDHFSRSLVQDEDPDVLSGMLTGVQQFVRDSFRFGQNRSLQEMRFGDYLVLIERGQFVYLAVVTSGGRPLGIARKLRSALLELEAADGDVFKSWNGEMDRVAGARDLIRSRLLRERRTRVKGS